MAVIQSYQFGEIVIEGKKYTSDVIIFPHRIDSNWWRKKGHELHPDDIQEIISEKPELLIVGTGDSGLMRVLPETSQHLAAHNIEFIVETTGKACQTYNKLCGSKKVIAALHLTC